MMNAIRNSCSLIVLILLLVMGTSGCKSKKKAMEAAAAEKARMEQEATTKRKNQEAQEEQLRLAEEKAKREEAEARQREIEAKANAAPKARLHNYFNAIAGSGNSKSANISIDEALTLFSSPETPVLIVISEEGGQKDYDKPTTIKNYLNYLKDQKKNSNAISNLQFDGSGKITELELRKSL